MVEWLPDIMASVDDGLDDIGVFFGVGRCDKKGRVRPVGGQYFEDCLGVDRVRSVVKRQRHQRFIGPYPGNGPG